MELRPLGNSGVRVSPIGLGTVKFGRTEGLKYRSAAAMPSDTEARALLRLARERGVTLLDTAPAYGSAEQRLGELLAGQRDHWTLVSKAGETFEHGKSSYDFTPEAVLASADASLARLRCDHLDVLLVHSDGSDLEIVNSLGTLDAVDELKARGTVRLGGLSSKTVEGARAAMDRVDVLMLTLNPCDQTMLPVVREAHAKGVGVLVKKALASGHTRDLARALAREPWWDTQDPADGAVEFALRESGASSVVLGTTRPAHLDAAVRVAARTDPRRPNPDP